MTKNKGLEPLVVERTFDAPVALVWRAMTQVGDIRRWYFDLKEFKPELGFEFAFVVEHQGTSYDHRCKVVEMIPQKKLAYTWRYEGQPGDSLVTIELFPEGKKTRVKLTHEGLETFPQTPAYARTNFERGWTSIVGESLKDFVENADREIFISRDFNAPRELVWEAMTDPKHITNWWGPRGFTTETESMDFRVSGTWKHVMRGPDGTKYPNQSVFKEIVRPERIVHAHSGKREDGPGTSFERTITLEALDANKTRVTLRGVFPSQTERDFVVKEFGAVEGGKQTLERLSEHLAGAQCAPFTISREFDAPRELVWKMCTEDEHMKNWFGPKGFERTTSKMDFRPGGIYHYGLRTPDGKDFWGRFIYREIVPQERIVFINSFSDANGGVTRHPWNPGWPLETLSRFTLTEKNGKTTLTVESVPYEATEAERNTFSDKGSRDSMKMGWGGTLDQLAERLAKIRK